MLCGLKISRTLYYWKFYPYVYPLTLSQRVYLMKLSWHYYFYFVVIACAKPFLSFPFHHFHQILGMFCFDFLIITDYPIQCPIIHAYELAIRALLHSYHQ
jgi:hypothetical protein